MIEKSWDTLENACYNCRRCRLCETRKNVVIGTGNKNADILFIGEAPGENEDIKGIPFVGQAGMLLDKILNCVDIKKDDIYITNVVKCRPPKNRDPNNDEKDSCINYLRYQLMLIKPKIIVCLGRIAAGVVISKDFRITKQRGIWYDIGNYKIIATYHPSALLRDETKKRPAWQDFKSIKKMLDSIKN